MCHYSICVLSARKLTQLVTSQQSLLASDGFFYEPGMFHRSCRPLMPRHALSKSRRIFAQPLARLWWLFPYCLHLIIVKFLLLWHWGYNCGIASGSDGLSCTSSSSILCEVSCCNSFLFHHSSRSFLTFHIVLIPSQTKPVKVNTPHTTLYVTFPPSIVATIMRYH